MQDAKQHLIESCADAIVHRLNSRAPLSQAARRWRGFTLSEMGRSVLELLGAQTRGLDRSAIATQMVQHRSGGFQTTSDFGAIMANVAAKRLRDGYEENPGSFRLWARHAPDAPDFKQMTVAQLSAMPDLLQVREHGEFTYGTMSDAAEKYSLITYGRIVSLTRQAIINDDLRAFDRVVTGFGQSAARLENRLVYAQLTGNPVMGDGNAVFSTAHANNGTGAASQLQFSSLATMRTSMRLQKGMQSEELNLMPAWLIVPAALEQSAYQLTSANYVPAKQSDVSEFRASGKTSLEPVVETLLDAVSPATWYSAARYGQCDTVEYCWLDRDGGPVVESQPGFEVDGISFKCRDDFAAKVIDWRGLYRAVGS